MSSEVFASVALRICAVGAVKVPLNEFFANPNLDRYKICGTGFLIADQTILTNRHVILGLSSYIEQRGIAKEQRHVAFLRPNGPEVSMSFHAIEKMGLARGADAPDIGMITFRSTADDPIRALSPVAIADEVACAAGDPIAVYGYAYGEQLLHRRIGLEDQAYRFGPILRRGYISALAPFDHTNKVDRLLLDVRTAPGMSGSPCLTLRPAPSGVFTNRV